MDYKLVSIEDYDSLYLGSVRPFKIAGTSKEVHIIPIQKSGANNIVIETPKFYSYGFLMNKIAVGANNGNGKATLIFSKPLIGDFMEEVNTQLKLKLYPLLLKKLADFQVEEEKVNRRLSPSYQKILDEGMDGKDTHWSMLFPDNKDAIFLKADPDALIIAEQRPGCYFQSQVKEHDSLPRRGQYKVRINIRFLLLQSVTEEGRQPLSVSFLVDQILHTPECGQAPRDVVLDMSGFFNTKQILPPYDESHPVDLDADNTFIDSLLNPSTSRDVTAAAATTDTGNKKISKKRKALPPPNTYGLMDDITKRIP